MLHEWGSFSHSGGGLRPRKATMSLMDLGLSPNFTNLDGDDELLIYLLFSPRTESKNYSSERKKNLARSSLANMSQEYQMQTTDFVLSS